MMPMNLRPSPLARDAGTRKLLLQLPELEDPRTAAPHRRPGWTGIDSCVSIAACGVPWQPGRWRYHQDFELHVIMAPFARAFVGDGVHSLAAGNVVLLGPRLPHNFEFVDAPKEDARASSPVLRFADDPLRRSMDWLPDLREAAPLLDRARQGVEFVGFRDLALAHLRQIRGGRGLERFSAFAALLHELARWNDSRTLGARPDRNAGTAGELRSQKILTVLDYLRVNYMQEFRLSDLSTMVQMHEAALSRQFRRITGTTFTAFVTQLRIGKACQLLLHTERQISSICYEVGFNNISNFNRHFLKRKGVTPGEYRALSGSGIR
jgi:AraC-like DNA-binding protein